MIKDNTLLSKLPQGAPCVPLQTKEGRKRPDLSEATIYDVIELLEKKGDDATWGTLRKPLLDWAARNTLYFSEEEFQTQSAFLAALLSLTNATEAKEGEKEDDSEKAEESHNLAAGVAEHINLNGEEGGVNRA
jgi:hypothetical protein